MLHIPHCPPDARPPIAYPIATSRHTALQAAGLVAVFTGFLMLGEAAVSAIQSTSGDAGGPSALSAAAGAVITAGGAALGYAYSSLALLGRARFWHSRYDKTAGELLKLMLVLAWVGWRGHGLVLQESWGVRGGSGRELDLQQLPSSAGLALLQSSFFCLGVHFTLLDSVPFLQRFGCKFSDVKQWSAFSAGEVAFGLGLVAALCLSVHSTMSKLLLQQQGDAGRLLSDYALLLAALAAHYCWQFIKARRRGGPAEGRRGSCGDSVSQGSDSGSQEGVSAAGVSAAGSTGGSQMRKTGSLSSTALHVHLHHYVCALILLPLTQMASSSPSSLPSSSSSFPSMDIFSLCLRCLVLGMIAEAGSVWGLDPVFLPSEPPHPRTADIPTIIWVCLLGILRDKQKAAAFARELWLPLDELLQALERRAATEEVDALESKEKSNTARSRQRRSSEVRGPEEAQGSSTAALAPLPSAASSSSPLQQLLQDFRPVITSARIMMRAMTRQSELVSQDQQPQEVEPETKNSSSDAAPAPRASLSSCDTSGILGKLHSLLSQQHSLQGAPQQQEHAAAASHASAGAAAAAAAAFGILCSLHMAIHAGQEELAGAFPQLAAVQATLFASRQQFAAEHVRMRMLRDEWQQQEGHCKQSAADSSSLPAEMLEEAFRVQSAVAATVLRISGGHTD